MRMRCSLVGAGILVLLGVPLVHGDDVPSRAAVEVGERVRVGIACQYQAHSIEVHEEWAEMTGRIVRRDELTLTVATRDGRETRYPALRARLVGRLTALEAHWLTLDLDDGGPEVRVPRLAVERLEVSRRPRKSARDGALRGAVMPGVPLGVVFFFLSGFQNFQCDYNCAPESDMYVGAAVGVALGAGLGAVFARLTSDRWEEVSIGVAVEPRPGKGMAGAVTLSF